jgi:hypothetical protein
MAEIPNTIVLKRDRDLDGREREIWIRRALFALVCVIPILALFNLFGQRAGSTTTEADAATLELYAPPRVRSGLLFEARFTVTAKRELKKAILRLSPGWAEGFTINTVEPAPTGEASDDGRLSFELGHIPAGSKHVLFLQFQVNPVNVGVHEQDVELDDGNQKVLTLQRDMTVFP